MIKIGGLWKSKAEGGTVLKGPLNAVSNLVILPNKFKRNEKDPDYMLFLSPNIKDNAVNNQKVDDL